MKMKRDDWFMFLFVLPFAILGPIIIYIGAKDQEEHKLQQMEQAVNIDRPRYDPREDSLVTREDSIHFYEDGM
jgi:hypothetical protein